MHPLVKPVALWLLNRCRFCFHSIADQQLLKFRPDELSTVVVDAIQWSRISCEPCIVNQCRYFLCVYIVNSCYFRPVRPLVYHGQGPYLCCFFWILARSSAPSTSHLIFHGPHKSTESSSQGLITLSSRSRSLPSLTTLVSFISLHVSHVPVIYLQRMPMPGHVKFARTLSSSLLAPGCWSVS